MRVAMIDPSLFTLPYDRALAAGLAGLGHEVTLHGRTLRADDPVPDTGGAGVTPDFYRLSGWAALRHLPGRVRLGVKGVDHVLSMARLLRRLRRARPAVIHFQWLPLPLVDGRLLAGFRRIAPLVLTVHDTDPFNGDPSSRLQAWGMGRCFPAFGRLILHTRQGAGRLERLGVEPGRIAVVPHGPLGPAAPAGADPMLGPPEFVLFGKIKPYKGADVLVEAVALLPEALRAQVRVRIVGQAYMDLRPLRTSIAAHGLTAQVRIEDRFVPEREVPQVLGPGTVAVFPYREIEASGVLQLALAAARPVLATRVGGLAEALVDGVHGRLVPPGDAAALATAMAEMLGDAGFRARCSAAVAGLAACGSGWAGIAARTAELYREAGA